MPEFTVFFNTLESHRNIAVAIQDMWKKHLGIEKVRIENQEWKVFQQTTQDLRYDVSRAGWIGDFVDPYTFLSIWRTGDSNNYTGWTNPEYDGFSRKAPSSATRRRVSPNSARPRPSSSTRCRSSRSTGTPASTCCTPT